MSNSSSIPIATVFLLIIFTWLFNAAWSLFKRRAEEIRIAKSMEKSNSLEKAMLIQRHEAHTSLIDLLVELEEMVGEVIPEVLQERKEDLNRIADDPKSPKRKNLANALAKEGIIAQDTWTVTEWENAVSSLIGKSYPKVVEGMEEQMRLSVKALVEDTNPFEMKGFAVFLKKRGVEPEPGWNSEEWIKALSDVMIRDIKENYPQARDIINKAEISLQPGKSSEPDP